jgi:hypothetical protein
MVVRWIMPTTLALVVFVVPLAAQEVEGDEAQGDQPTAVQPAESEAEEAQPVTSRFFLTDPAVIHKVLGIEMVNRTFPLWKSVAGDRALPRPLSVGLIFYWQNQDYNIDSAAIGLEPLPPVELDIEGTVAKIDSKTIGVKAGLWLLPFLNLTATVGHATTDSDIWLQNVPIAINPPSRPGEEPEVVRGEKLLELGFEGPFWALSATVVGGYQRWFGSVTFSYGDAKLDATLSAIGENNFSSERVLPKFGYAFEGTSVWIGAVWMEEESHQVGSLEGFTYDVMISRTDWTPVAGIHTLLGEHWELMVEGGFGDRVSSQFLLGYRF